MKKVLSTLLVMLACVASVNAQQVITPQTLDDLPLDEIFKLVDNSISSEDLLKAQNYKYVGEYSAGRGAQTTWCRNCTCNKRGDVLSFQKGTSSIICLWEEMGRPENAGEDHL